MRYLRVSAAQAAALRGKYGNWHALDPVPLADSDDYILTDAVLSESAFVDVLETLESLDEYPQWQPDTVYGVGAIVEFGDRLKRCIQAHTSLAVWTPDAAPALWVTAHRDGEIPAWAQPTGSHDTWPLDALVRHSGRVWQSLKNANTDEPGAVGTWRDQSEPPIWVAPAGSIGLWQVDDVVEHQGQIWRNTSPNNSFAPGVFGWVVVNP